MFEFGQGALNTIENIALVFSVDSGGGAKWTTAAEYLQRYVTKFGPKVHKCGGLKPIDIWIDGLLELYSSGPYTVKWPSLIWLWELLH